MIPPKMHVVTSSAGYIDIDAYAGCIAYAQLLNLQDIEAVAASSAVLNESITSTIRSWPVSFKTAYVPDPADTFTLVDASDPACIDKVADTTRVTEVIDHHTEFEEYWLARIGNNVHIEQIGAACTQVYERWQTAGLLNRMPPVTAKLLAAGILDNALNFQARITTVRDRVAFADLSRRSKLPATWPQDYFRECQELITQDLPAAVKNDSKILRLNGLEQSVCFGQLVIWNGSTVVRHNQDDIMQILTGLCPRWLMNVVSISEEKSYFICKNPYIQKWLSGVANVQFNGSVATAERPWLRKEIVKQATSLSMQAGSYITN